MKIIGIDGNLGSGKTIVSKYILRNSKRKIIHLDRVFTKVKKKYLKNDINTYVNKNGEKEVLLNNNSLARKLLNLKFVYCLFFEYKKKYLQKMMKYLIELYQDDLDYLIIEGFGLNKYDLDKYLNYLIFIETDANIRYERFTKREDINEKNKYNSNNKRKLNSFYTTEVKRYPHDFCFTINNNYQKKDLKRQMDDIEDFVMVLK